MPRRPKVAEMVADATLLAVAAVRQSIKNLMIVRALRDSLDFDPEWYADAVRRELESFAAEKDADAARVGRALVQARYLDGAAEHATDYRTADLRAQRRRQRTLVALAAELRRLAEQESFVAGIIADARTRALDEIAATAASVPRTGGVPPVRGIARSRALQALRDELSDYTDD